MQARTLFIDEATEHRSAQRRFSAKRTIALLLLVYGLSYFILMDRSAPAVWGEYIVAIPFSLPKILEEKGKGAAAKRIFVRSIVLFVLGVIYMGGVANGFKNIYLAGVLQRIAVAYFFAALLFLFFKPRGLILLTGGLLLGY